MDRRRFALTRWQAWLLAALLLAAQAAGLAHRISHGGHAGAARLAALQAAGPEGAASHDEGSAQCRLVDQLTHADALCGGELTAAPARVAQGAGPARIEGRLAEGAPAAYLARAPPRG